MEFGFIRGWVKYDMDCGCSVFSGFSGALSVSGEYVVFFSSIAGVSSMSYLAIDVLNTFYVWLADRKSRIFMSFAFSAFIIGDKYLRFATC